MYNYYSNKQQSGGSYWSDFKNILNSIKNDNSDSKKSRTKLVQRNFSQKIVRKHRPDYKMFMMAVILVMVGLVIMYSISPLKVNLINLAKGERVYGELYYFIKYIVAGLVSLAVFGVVKFIPVDFWRKNAIWFLALGGTLSFLLILLSKTGSRFALCTNGACRWLSLPLVGSLQVAEVLKFGLLLFLAAFWAVLIKQQRFNSTFNLKYSVPILLVSLALIVGAQNDLGTGISLIITVLAMAWAAGIKKNVLAGLFVIILVLAALAIAVKPHRMSRLTTFLKGDNITITDDTRHSVEARIAIGSGGVFGLGIGQSIQATGYLPESINDSVFAVIGEMFGFVGTILILFLFLILLFKLLKIAEYLHDDFSRLVTVGTFGWIFSHVFINVSSMIGLMPMTGITLPFLSYGGTSLVIMFLIIALVFNMSRFTAHSPAERNNNG